MLPRSMGVADGSPEAVERQVMIAQHVRAVVSARALTPAEQVRVLMMAASSVIVSHSCARGGTRRWCMRWSS